ncbi:MAG: acyl-CoA dehydrogenase family protein [Spirillospora sp.]
MSPLAEEIRHLVDDMVRREGVPDTADEQRALWTRLRELGLSRIGIDEEHGGSGGTFDDLMVVVETLAAHGTSQPIVEAATADWTLSHTGPLDDPFTTLVLLDEPLDTDGAVELRGVPWARDAERLVICAPGDTTLVVDLDAATVRPGENLAGEPRDTVRLTATSLAALDPAPEYAVIRARLALLWSAAVTGAAHGAYRLTRTYVAERHQFGAPLLKIPAVATNLALMRVELVQADAALAQARGMDPAAAATARIVTASAATKIAQIAHQLHGAIGITMEYPLHRRTRRLWAWRDAVATERSWAEDLGRRAAAAGEDGIWTRLTATVPE